MGIDVASFAKQLVEDGIDAAKAESEKIIAEAKKNAEVIISNAKSDALKLHEEAENKIAQSKQRSEAELQLAARDAINSVKKSIEQAGTSLLKDKVAEVVNEKEVLTNAINELLKNQSSGNSDWEINLSKNLSKPLADLVTNLFKNNGAKVKLSQELNKAGFELTAGSSNEVIEITDESVAESFKKLLSPELKKIVEANL